jgi:rhomboid protease GluP
MNLWIALTSGFRGVVWLEASFRLREKPRRPPALTLTACLVLAACLLVQLRYPQALELFDRNAGEIRVGEWWRLLTALFFQDGWLAGGSVNILLLFAIGNLAEQVRSRPEWLLIAAGGALAGELLGLRWEPVGAGNSIVTCALAGSLIQLRSFRKASVSSKLLWITAIAISSVLITRRDIHGAAAAIGFLVGLTKPVRIRPRRENLCVTASASEPSQ